MKYIKLIALKVNDFSSVIFFENNYRLNQKTQVFENNKIEDSRDDLPSIKE